ncbi:hypothetical protein [Pedobacter sp. Leaf176]|uniref:hypothetical protein n=1 Tax=Pedobacter sp. Leaf176 TaxID=1736286 RepID=UPI0006FC4E78|nr:hypothetical protein [Pedobacter sp. Leaf176]KQR72256.1 hypothetical protein ASF92_02885 [Pedobacter sp. Leaf176]
MKKLFLITTLLIGAISNGHSQNSSDSSIKVSYTVKKTGIKKPLYIIDGVKQINPESITDSFRPDSIAEITILRHDDAIKLFGIEAIDGAIVITTKSMNKQVDKINLEQKNSILPKEKDINSPANFRAYNDTFEKGIAIKSLNGKPNITFRGIDKQFLPNYNDAIYILDGQKIEKEALSWLNPNTIRAFQY